MGNAVLRAAIYEANDSVRAGVSLPEALSRTRFFSHGYCWLLNTSEQQGEIGTALLSLAENYEQEMKHQQAVMVSVMVPLFNVILGCLIGFFVSALYLPIFTLGDAIAGS